MVTKSGAVGPFRNALLAALPAAALEKLAPVPVPLDVNFVLYEPNAPIEHVYFPEAGAVSVISTMQDTRSIEVGTIGREGMAGSFLLLDKEPVPYRFFIQMAGRGYRTTVEAFEKVVASNAEWRAAVLRYEALFRMQTMQGMACNGLHSVEQRCCRWLLMTRDRGDSDEIRLTHEFLALMLGVRRATVSDVLAPLQRSGVVENGRGTITILDRQALETRACECYQVMAKREGFA